MNEVRSHSNRLTAHIATKGIFLLCIVFSASILYFVYLPLLDAANEYLTNIESIWQTVLIWVAYAVFFSLLGLMVYPFVRLMEIKSEKIGWLGEMYRVLDQDRTKS